MLVLTFLAILLGMVTPKPLWAHRDDYLNETFVYQTIERHEFEPEYWLEFDKARGDADDFFLNSLAFEYGITSRWMVDGAGILKTTTKGDNSFHRARVETRYRFAEEGAWPIDLAASLEYEVEDGLGREHFLDPRLVLSKDILPKLNTTVNLFSELRLSGLKARGGYAFGLRYPAEALLRYGLEVQGLHPDPNELRIIPQIWFSFPHEITFKLGSGVGFLETEERFFVRGVIEVEL